MDICIVGGGYWGIASALMLSKEGHNVTLLDSGTTLSGSLNAGGHFSLDWFSGQMKKEMKVAYEDAVSFGVKINTEGALINTIYDRKKYGINYFKDKKDWWFFFPEQFLSLFKDKKLERVSMLKELDGKVKVFTIKKGKDKEYGEYDWCIVCGGVWTDILLVNSGMKPTGVYPLAGSSVVLKGKNIEKLKLHQLNPFRQISVRNWGDNKIRVGETSEKQGSDSEPYVNKMLERVSHITHGANIVSVAHGYRAMLKKPFVGKVGNKVVAATGGGRNGGIMSFWAARKIMGIIK